MEIYSSGKSLWVRSSSEESLRRIKFVKVCRAEVSKVCRVTEIFSFGRNNFSQQKFIREKKVAKIEKFSSAESFRRLKSKSS